MLNKKLELIRSFQNDYPDAYLGGSIALMIYGKNLKRDLNKADIDFSIRSELKLPFSLDTNIIEESSDTSDFDYAFRVSENTNSAYTKLDIRKRTIVENDDFFLATYEGFEYKLQPLEHIIYWKKKFADKGVKKHIDDLAVLDGKERAMVIIADEIDDLPF